MTDEAIKLLVQYAEGRQAERMQLRQVRALRCERVSHGEDAEGPPCYQYGESDISNWCATCQRRNPLFQQMVARKRANRKLLRRLEQAALRTEREVPAGPPKALLALMEPEPLTPPGH